MHCGPSFSSANYWYMSHGNCIEVMVVLHRWQAVGSVSPSNKTTDAPDERRHLFRRALATVKSNAPSHLRDSFLHKFDLKLCGSARCAALCAEA